MDSLKISFCTTCMNRLSHLKQTLKRNILDNEDYPNLEFILLDYNSTDGLKEYVRLELRPFIERKKLVYYRTEEPKKYNMSHSRNLAYKLATGDIICNIDADNFTGPGFATYVRGVFKSNENVFLSTHDERKVERDVLGRICVKKSDFLAVNGYDESMKYYGFDDYDFQNRLRLLGLTKHVITAPEFLRAISHSNAERMENFSLPKLEKLVIKYISPAESTLYFLFTNGTCSVGTIISNHNFNVLAGNDAIKKSLRYRFSIAEQAWRDGVWQNKNDRLSIKLDRVAFELVYQRHNWLEDVAKNRYRDITSPVIIEEMLFFLHQVSNRIIMENNVSNGTYKVNNGIFGKGVVSKELN